MLLPSALITAMTHAPDAIHRIGDDAASDFDAFSFTSS